MFICFGYVISMYVNSKTWNFRLYKTDRSLPVGCTLSVKLTTLNVLSNFVNLISMAVWDKEKGTINLELLAKSFCTEVVFIIYLKKDVLGD